MGGFGTTYTELLRACALAQATVLCPLLLAAATADALCKAPYSTRCSSAGCKPTNWRANALAQLTLLCPVLLAAATADASCKASYSPPPGPNATCKTIHRHACCHAHPSHACCSARCSHFHTRYPSLMLVVPSTSPSAPLLASSGKHPHALPCTLQSPSQLLPWPAATAQPCLHRQTAAGHGTAAMCFC